MTTTTPREAKSIPGGDMSREARPQEAVEFASSPLKLLLLTGAGIVMTAASALLALRIGGPGSYAEFVGYVGLTFFGLGTLLLVWRLFTGRGVAVTLNSEGLRDARISEKVIPWSVVRDITTWQSHRQRIMVIAVDPAFEERLGLSRIARMAREANKALGADGLTIAANDLSTSYETLLATTVAFWKKYG